MADLRKNDEIALIIFEGVVAGVVIVALSFLLGFGALYALNAIISM